MKNIDNFWYIFPIVIMITTLIIIIYGYIIIKAIKNYNLKSVELKNNLEELRLKQEKLILEAEVEIQEETFQFISKEIHDNIIQVLSFAQINVYNLYNENPGKKKNLDIIKESISKAIHDLNDLSKSLDSDMIEKHGLIESIKYEIDKWQKHVKSKINFNFQKNKSTNLSSNDLILFRIFQEAINNAFKHAKAENIDINLNYTHDLVTLIIEDNGTGFNVDEITNAKIIGKMSGLRNMRKRAESLNGIFEIISTPKIGTKIIITIPIQI